MLKKLVALGLVLGAAACPTQAPQKWDGTLERKFMIGCMSTRPARVWAVAQKFCDCSLSELEKVISPEEARAIEYRDRPFDLEVLRAAAASCAGYLEQ